MWLGDERGQIREVRQVRGGLGRLAEATRVRREERMRRRAPTISYRTDESDGRPPLGAILMGTGPRVRRAYRILVARRVKSSSWRVGSGLGTVTWKLTVERMSAAAGRDEIAAGVPWRSIVWDKRSRRRA